MDLKEYLQRESISQREFARSIGISNSTVCAIIRGKRPSPKTAKLIESRTYGKVKAKDLLQLEPWVRVASYR